MHRKTKKNLKANKWRKAFFCQRGKNLGQRLRPSAEAKRRQVYRPYFLFLVWNKHSYFIWRVWWTESKELYIFSLCKFPVNKSEKGELSVTHSLKYWDIIWKSRGCIMVNEVPREVPRPKGFVLAAGWLT